MRAIKPLTDFETAVYALVPGMAENIIASSERTGNRTWWTHGMRLQSSRNLLLGSIALTAIAATALALSDEEEHPTRHSLAVAFTAGLALLTSGAACQAYKTATQFRSLFNATVIQYNHRHQQ